jgi:glucokinase
VVTLQAGEPSPQGPRVAIGAGTGLGVAYLVWQDGRYRAIPSEGGHTGFAPASEEQARLWGFLQGRLGRVEWEDVVSGSGLEAIHAFFSGKDWAPGAAPTTAAEVASRALDHDDAIASHALDVFASCYGAVAGDHALALLARGGVYIAGGIAPKILPRLVEGPFLAGFNAKRQYESLARSIPVRVVTNERVGLLGALLLAVRAARQD